MSAFGDWFVMGGYGWYVWLSYGAGLVVIALNLWLPLRRHRRLRARLAPGHTNGRAAGGN